MTGESLDEQLDRKVADEQITDVDATEVRTFASFLRAAGPADDHSPAARRQTLAAWADHYPDDYRTKMATDPRWATVRGQIGATVRDGGGTGGHRPIELFVTWRDETVSCRYMWRPGDPGELTIRQVLDEMVRYLDAELDERAGAEPPSPTPATPEGAS